MGPVSEADGHDEPGLVDELVPSVTAVINNLLVGTQDPVGEPVVAHDCQTFSTGFNSGDRGGSGRSVMLAGTFSLGETCQPAWSSSSTACASGATAWLTSSSWAAMASVSQ